MQRLLKIITPILISSLNNTEFAIVRVSLFCFIFNYFISKIDKALLYVGS